MWRVGDIVRVNDGSYSMMITPRGLDHSYGARMTGRDYRVIAVQPGLPSEEADQPNDTMIQALDNGEVVFIQGDLCSLSPNAPAHGCRCSQCPYHGK